MARAGGKDAEKLPEALAEAERLIRAARSEVLALDYGAARTGVAVSDATGTLARPVCVVERAAARRASTRLAALVAEHEAELVVVGLPLTLRGERGEQARETEAFVEVAARRVEVPVETEDERFTTTLAQQSGGKAPEDALAAAHLLQGWLERTAVTRVRRGPAPRSRRGRRGVRRGGWVAGGRRARRAPADDHGARAARSGCGSSSRRASRSARWPTASPPSGRSRSRSGSVTPRLTRAGYLRAVERALAPPRFRKDVKRDSLEGFLFPASYEFTQQTTARELVADQLDAFRERFARRRPRATRARRT